MSKLSAQERSDLLERANERFKYGLDRDDKNRERQIEDTKFVYMPGEQWTAKVRKLREEWGDPCMEFPQLRQFVNQVVNDQRQNRPGVRVHPASGNASDDVAETLQGLIRGIEYDSNAEAVYDCAYQHSVVGGRGYWRIVSAYERPDSFDQKLVLQRIPDPLSVILDPDYRDPDGGDRNWGFVLESIPRKEFEKLYPDAEVLDYSEDVKHWHPDEKHVYVADYYERTAHKRNLVQLSTGEVAWEDALPDPLPEGITIVDVRAMDDYRVAWYTIAGGEQVLDEHEWPGSIIPVIATMGDEIIVEGERHFQGLITPARGAQELFNYGMTQQAIHLGMTPRAPYVAAVGQIEGLEDHWNNANQRNYSVLPYKPQTVDGTIVPPPQRQMGAQPDAGWINWTQQMQLLMKSTLGMYENTLGMRGSETSGRAIMAREKQGDNATFHFQDNLSRAIALTGRVLVELIPHYYDTQRIVQIVTPDDKRKMVTLNESGALGAIAKNDVRVGKYGVTVAAGPSYATKRQETADLLTQMVQAFPPMMQVAGDLVVKAQDIPDADLIAQRMKLAMPPNVQQAIQAEEQAAGEGPVIPPQVQQQLAQLQQALQQAQQQLQMLAQQNQQLQAEAQSEQQKLAADAQMKQIDLQMAQLELQVKQIEAQIESSQGAMKAEVELQKVQLERDKLAHERAAAGMPPQPSDEGFNESQAKEQAEEARQLALIQAVNNAAAQFAHVAAALSAPKRTKLVTDAAGMPVASVTEPVLQ